MSIQWSLVFFTLFVGLGTGIFVAAVAISEWWGHAKQVRVPAASAAFVLLILGGLSSVLHLGHPERLFGALGHPTSGIFMESLMIGLMELDIVAYVVAIRRGAKDGTCRAIAIIGIIPAIVLAFAVGDTYVLASRPAWNTLILPLFYVASTAVMGCFAVRTLLRHSNEVEINRQIDRTALIALGVQTILLVLYVAHMAIAPYQSPSRSASRILIGDLMPLFWIGVVFVGIVIPACLMWKAMTSQPRVTSMKSQAVWSLACVLMGGVAFRVLMFSVGSGIRQFFPYGV